MNMKISTLLLIILISLPVQAGFIGGLGYMKPEEYRVGNNINPLPFGLSVVPMLAYRGERLRVLGPNVSYLLLRGMFSFGLRVNATGDRYESEEIEMRDTAINGGVFMRLLFLTLSWGRDISGEYNADTASISIGWRFKLTERLIFSPSVRQVYLSEEYANYYYGVRANEVGRFLEYEVPSAENTIVRVGLRYILNRNNSLAFNYSHRYFDSVIYQSPTVGKKSHGTVSFFWSYGF